jgi:glycosyltransferase involved in cell wall biosynthesis
MACGTPVVATPNGGSDEILDQGKWGKLVRAEELGQALVELLGCEADRRMLAERGVERAKAYDIARIAQRYEELYLHATACCAPASG